MSVCGMGEGVFLKRRGGGVHTYSILSWSSKKIATYYLKFHFFFLQIFCVITSEGMSMHCQNNYAMFVLSLMT